MYGSLDDFPLRQRKFVKTRNSVLKATTHLLKEKSFDEITVDEICHKSQISRGTFFNYFLQKNHIFHYYVRIFTIKIMLRIQHWDNHMTLKDQLKQLYIWFNEESQYPNFVNAYINYLLEDGSRNNMIRLTEAEFVYFFTGLEDKDAYEYYNNLTIEDIIKDLYMASQEKGQAPQDSDPNHMAKVFLSFLISPFITYKALETDTDPNILFDIILDGFL